MAPPPRRFRHCRPRPRRCPAVAAAAVRAAGRRLPQPLPLFPADNWWNVDVSQAPVDPGSAAFIAWIGGTGGKRVHPDWGASANDPGDPTATYGMPYVSVPGSQPLVPVTWVAYGDESDDGAPGRPPGYPIPPEARTPPATSRAGSPATSTPAATATCSWSTATIGCCTSCIARAGTAPQNRWEAESGAIFDLTRNGRRPEGWTSADAAGLAIMPGLARYDEVFGTAPIRHALRVTVRATNGYVWPASHRAGSTTGALPMGARLRLKASKDISSYPAHLQRLFQAMKTYGLIVADNGSDMYVTGTNDPRWTPYMDGIVNAVHALRSTDFEVVTLGWQPAAAPADADNDGLPDDWERDYGLDPASGSGNNGPIGDPDGDGTNNADERTAGTHPRGFTVRLLAEGLRQARSPPASRWPIRRQSRPRTRSSASNETMGWWCGCATGPASQRVTVTRAPSPNCRPCLRDRRRVGRVRGGRSSGAMGSGPRQPCRARPARPVDRWYFAEGATYTGFSLFYLLQNPGDALAHVTVTYLREPPLAPLVRTHEVPAHSRRTVWVNTDEAGTATPASGAASSAVIASDVPIVAERAMYRSVPNTFEAGHASAGAPALRTSWYFAEGHTGPFFEQYLLLGNPGTSPVPVRVVYLLPTGPTPPVTYVVRRAAD